MTELIFVCSDWQHWRVVFWIMRVMLQLFCVEQSLGFFIGCPCLLIQHIYSYPPTNYKLQIAWELSQEIWEDRQSNPGSDILVTQVISGAHSTSYLTGVSLTEG
jgi:hypothetical protein